MPLTETVEVTNSSRNLTLGRKIEMNRRVKINRPDDPHDDTDDGDEEGEKGEGKAQEKAQWPAISICVAHDYEFPLFLFQSLSLCFLEMKKILFVASVNMF